ncbi:tRNA pseudouridine(38-40) synthase TruA [Thiotrichales bacterium 19S3-7]|nr:tRNA pseudouridine(38-40) synthase TruA [Thiotrichales bacterium 19S3-7]MCF6801183.1 tRNA pseudouridine(38-40) synthase TruA [Thiotrichales bacterium 19S3-11]
MKIACGVEYLGKNYHGWQRQKHCLGIQERIEKALSFVADQSIEVVCAGRTDQGVHATNQIIHFDTDSKRMMTAWLRGGNAYLPKDIKLLWAKEVDETFHARFSAKWRTYRYVIYTRVTSSAILDGLVTWVKESLDIEAMREAMVDLLGERDFSSFRAAECQSHSAFRNIMSIELIEKGHFLIFEIKGNAFLHHMVRNIVGTLLEVGLKRKQISWIKELLLLKDRRCAGKTAASDGLYLVDVGYDEQYCLPRLALGPDFLHA